MNASPVDAPAHQRLVVETLRGLIAESDPAHARREIGLDQSLSRDLAIGSLERVELLLRLERASGCSLPETVLAEADTPRQLSAALDRAGATPTADRSPASVTDLGTATRGASQRGPAPASTRTLVEALRFHADRTPDAVHIVLRDDTGTERPITYAALWQSAAGVAAGLRARGVAPRERVALLLRTERAFFDAYFGILLAGAVPVPLYPPFRADQIEEYARRQAGILRNAEARTLLTFAQAERAAGLLRPLAPTLTDVVTVDEVTSPDAGGALPHVVDTDLALIQYTSGSTGSPKGVALSHANLLANIRAFGEVFAVRPDDVVVTWLPLYHDMGLIGTWLGPVYHGVPTVVMSPLAFLSRPARWLQAFHAHRGTLAAAPNFAYDLCVRKIADDEIEGIDLGSWRSALNGAEAVMAATVERFTERFARHGFRREAMKPVYGLAESSLCVTAPPRDRAPRIDRIARVPFERSRSIEPAPPDEAQPLTFVACGRPIPQHEVRIVDERGQTLEDRTEGRIEFRGPSAMQGYFRNAEATAAVVRDGGWVDTGDLGYWVDGDLFVTGRVKDTIIAGGRNIYPQEVEEAVGLVSGIRRGCVAAFGLGDAASGTERLVVVAEVRETGGTERAALTEAVNASVVGAIGIPPDVVVLARPGSIPKTSSGKIRRNATRDLYRQGTLGRGRVSMAWQWSRLVARSIGWHAGRLVHRLRAWIFTGRAYLVVVTLVPVLWLRLLLIRDPHAARRATGASARRMLQLAGCRVEVTGAAAATLATHRPALLVANHASYLDVIALLAVLPDHVRFAAKARLATYPILRTVLRRADHLLVERGVAAGADELAETLDRGDSLFIFPEGTFGRAPGVTAFRLGAFHAAVETGRPVLPIALQGTRQIWPDGTLVLRPGEMTVVMGEPLFPAAKGWSEIVRLRDTARIWIADHCGEPIVDRGTVMIDVPQRDNPSPPM
jgi:fatty-acyl-CoA synthase